MKRKELEASGGQTTTRAEIERVERALSAALPAELAKLLLSWPLIGAEFSLDEDADESGLGVAIRWMSPDEMISEATESYPGIVAVPRGLFPIGICLEGSGDPYFFRAGDGAVVRIPHDAATTDSLDEARIEVVAPSVRKLLALAAPD